MGRKIENMLGDRVAVRGSEGALTKGVIAQIAGDRVFVQVDDSDERVETESSKIRNYSLAARKAWASMPSRGVGRPRGSGLSNRVSVTLRIDRELWNRFKELERAGKISDRGDAIDASLRHILKGYFDPE